MGYTCYYYLYFSLVNLVGFPQVRPLPSAQNPKKAPLTVQVIAEQFKWIFIYPEQNIATVNELRFPEQTPVSFTFNI